MKVTTDIVFGLELDQPARGEGYRVNVDALHLARFARREGRIAKHAVDLGSGVGTVGLLLLRAGGAARVTLVEREPSMVALCRSNVARNGVSGEARVLEGDVTNPELLLDARADLVVSNPPFSPEGRGRVPRDAVRHAKVGPLEPFVVLARRALAPRGRACFVYPATETVRLFSTLRASGLEPKRIAFVHARLALPARIVLVEALPGKPGGLVVEPPWTDAGLGPGSAA